MNGTRQVRKGTSKLASVSMLAALSVGWLALMPAILIAATSIEQVLTNQDFPVLLERFLAVTAPALSISAMSAPLLMCYRAVKSGNPNHGLQWPLFISFGVSCCLGVAYGLRQDVYAIVASSAVGALVQMISLGCVYGLGEGPHRSSAYLFDRVAMCLPRGYRSIRLAFHWLLYTVLVGTCVAALMFFAYAIPLHTALGPIYSLTCVLPYLATFITLPRDIASYREWAALPLNAAGKREGPKGVDLTTLATMQVNNALWFWYGFLIKDSAVLTSSTFSFIAAAVQIVVYLCPVIDLPWKGSMIRLDPAYMFLGEGCLDKKGGIGPRQSSDARNFIGLELTNRESLSQSALPYFTLSENRAVVPTLVTEVDPYTEGNSHSYAHDNSQPYASWGLWQSVSTNTAGPSPMDDANLECIV
ncbi:sugar efflux transporter for intercellular exchange protein [Gregarina niphandrodes]|uniref:Sugar efflux transporter for intercellular exchange protein n=1 Tax=Gregarina niphandrodes TaxID=110365 RepID=A0A023B7P1_GRENI|nr:sugar efflux transporter for intercellular exchange protein [Gregarina niphandrodes]EZG67638.1 sugar efflux transporter for intercellular exchange protein [Gregarina niphandrodes]|eukprot:XP_011130191.1 sugar efflux transporter for intercellular exchange protein [Gregarina niphandrodes]